MRESLREIMRDVRDSDIDGFLVTEISDIRYLTGFTGSNAALLVSSRGPDGDVFSTDARYVEQAHEQCPDLGVLVDRECAAAVARQSVTQGAARVALDGHASLDLADAVIAAGLECHRVTGIIARLREVKSPGEIDALTLANEITSRAVDALVAEIRVGDTEVLLARRLEWMFAEYGAEERAFPTIVAAGPNSAIPHHEPGGRPLERGDLLVIDCGARVRGYHADMTRTFIVGEPEGWQSELFDVVAKAAAAGRAAARVGVPLVEIDAAARRIIEGAGFGGYFGHGLGHGTGLDIHEAPMIGPRSEGRLREDTTITVEPGVYLPGRGGVRIEDSLLVTADGPRCLTESPRDLRVVG